MSEEDRERFEQLRAALMPAYRAVRRLFEVIAEQMRRLYRALRPFLCTLCGIRARQQWRQAQTTARFLSRHPDLRAMDGWLDQLYPGMP